MKGGISVSATGAISSVISEDFFRVVFAEGLAQAQVGVRKGVRPGKGAHGDILRGPFADAGNLAKLQQRSFQPVSRFQKQLTPMNRLRQRNQSFSTLSGNSQFANLAHRGPGNARFCFAEKDNPTMQHLS